MPHVTQAQLAGELPPAFLAEALLDESGAGLTPDEIWDAVQASVDDDIFGALAPRYTPPYAVADPILYTVRSAARVLTLHKLFQRRGRYGEMNPWEAAAESALRQLRAIGQGSVKSPAGTTPPPRGSVAVVSENAVTTSRRGGRP